MQKEWSSVLISSSILWSILDFESMQIKLICPPFNFAKIILSVRVQFTISFLSIHWSSTDSYHSFLTLKHLKNKSSPGVLNQSFPLRSWILISNGNISHQNTSLTLSLCVSPGDTEQKGWMGVTIKSQRTDNFQDICKKCNLSVALMMSARCCVQQGIGLKRLWRSQGKPFQMECGAGKGTPSQQKELDMDRWVCAPAPAWANYWCHLDPI